MAGPPKTASSTSQRKLILLIGHTFKFQNKTGLDAKAYSELLQIQSGLSVQCPSTVCALSANLRNSKHDRSKIQSYYGQASYAKEIRDLKYLFLYLKSMNGIFLYCNIIVQPTRYIYTYSTRLSVHSSELGPPPSHKRGELTLACG